MFSQKNNANYNLSIFLHIVCGCPFVPLPQSLKILGAGPGELGPPGEQCSLSSLRRFPC